VVIGVLLPTGRLPWQYRCSSNIAAVGPMASDPVSRLQFARDETDRVLGPGYAAAHPDVVIAVMQSAASDYAALAIARALQDVALALAEPADEPPIVPARELLRARP
jgi:hypothetical protein